MKKKRKYETTEKGSVENSPKKVDSTTSSHAGRRLDHARVSEHLDNLQLSEVLKKYLKVVFVDKDATDLQISNENLDVIEDELL